MACLLEPRLAAQLALPSDPVFFEVAYEGSGTSFLQVGLLDIPRGYAVSNIVYDGWCVEHHKPIQADQAYWGRLYDSLGANLPPHLRDIPWDKLNYILNHKQGGMHDVQNAIWCVLDQGLEEPFTVEAQAMTNAAAQFGGGFVPADGQICSVILDHVNTNYQRVIFETVCVRGCTNVGVPVEFSLSVESFQPGGPFVGKVHGVSDECYVIESASNLLDWVEIYKARSTAEFLQFKDPNPLGERRFYRAVVRRDPVAVR